mmetsp:Transcript_55672/g.99137  ORF Transcript_55672/g.99137 Transcript_55672/m.99137 type:complete len:114 (+) Transcript_55672:181-522(+)
MASDWEDSRPPKLGEGARPRPLGVGDCGESGDPCRAKRPIEVEGVAVPDGGNGNEEAEADRQPVDVDEGIIGVMQDPLAELGKERSDADFDGHPKLWFCDERARAANAESGDT